MAGKSSQELSDLEVEAIDYMMACLIKETMTKLDEMAQEYNIDTPTLTLLMHKFICDFARSGWHGHKPSEILLETIKITKAVGQDTKA